MSIKDDILGSMAPGKTYSAQDFNSLGSKSAVNKGLSRLSSEGKIKRLGPGTYSRGLRNNNAAEALLNRIDLAEKMGMMYGGLRDTFKVLGYKKTIRYKDYWSLYKRGDVAARIIEAPVRATWRNGPKVFVAGGDEWNTAWKDLWSSLKLLHFIMRADKLSRIGRYSVLLIGVADGKELDEPLEEGRNNDILYVMPFDEDDAKIKTFVTDAQDERFGMPDMYEINLRGDLKVTGAKGALQKHEVHHSRVIHVAENLLKDNVFGTPALERVYNRFDDMLKVVGGNSEAFWKIVDRGMALILDKEAELDPDTEADFEQEVENYIHGFKRYMRLQGMDIKNLGSDPSDPRGSFEVLVTLIAGACEIPKRILFGSERGQLASSQDERNFNSNIIVRRDEFAEPCMLRPLIDIFTLSGALPALKENQTIEYEWPDLTAPSTKEKADIARTIGRAIRDVAMAVESQIISRDEGRTLFKDFFELEDEDTPK